jgi:hypothetical protein
MRGTILSLPLWNHGILPVPCPGPYNSKEPALTSSGARSSNQQRRTVSGNNCNPALSLFLRMRS